MKQSGLDRRQYLRHFLIILSGNGAAQIANLLGYPLLARLYSPDNFGAFGMFVAVAAIPGTLACGRFEFAIPTAPRWGAASVLWLCIAISAVIGLLSIGGGALYWWVSSTSFYPELPILLGLCVFLTGVCAANSMFLMRHERYRAFSASVLVRTATAVTSQAGLAFISASTMSLIVGFTLGLLAQAIMLSAISWRKIRLGMPRRRNLQAMFFRFRRQVFVDFPSTLVAALASNILTFALAILYDPRTVGFYSIGSRLAIVPLTLFNAALAQIFFQKAARAREEKGHLWDEMKFSLMTSGLLSLGVLVSIMLFARPFIGIFLGPNWIPAADMLVILAPMLAMQSVAMSIGTTVFVLRSTHWLFTHNVATVVVPLAAYAVAALLHLNPIGFLTIASGLLTCEYGLFALFLVSAARRDRRLAGG